MKKEKRIIQVIVKSGLITWVLLLLIWQIGSLFYSDDFLPGPFTTFAGAGKLVASGDLFRDILISMQRVLKGWLLGILFAIPAGLCIGHFKKIGAIFEPFLNFFRFVPAIGFITLFLMWFGVGEKSKVALIFYAVIFPVMINTIAGVRTVDDALIEASESLGADGAKTFFYGDHPVCSSKYFYRCAFRIKRCDHLHRGGRNVSSLRRNRLSDLYIKTLL